MFKNLAPIILFTYNRPSHTERTLTALMRNNLAKESILYIYCDGPKAEAGEEQKQKVEEVRYIVKKQKWCKEVYISESDVNKGLARSIIEGVTEIINQHQKVIVLEDDLVTSKYFLNYMNLALDFYKDKKTVYSISADRPSYSRFKIPKDYHYDVFVSLRPFSYGWGTWLDRWEKIDWSLDYLNPFLDKPEQISAFNRGGEDLTPMLISQSENKIDSWAIRFCFAHFSNHAISILPCISYIDNIGCDSSGVHSGNNEIQFRKDTSIAPEVPRFLDHLYEDRRIINSFYSSYYPKKRPMWKKMINRFARMLGKENVFTIKKKVYV